MREYRIDTGSSGQRLDKFCRRILSFAPSSFTYKMLRKKNIKLNGKKAAGNELLKKGDTVTFFLSDETFDKFHLGVQEDAPDFFEYERAYRMLSPEILYEDGDVLFVVKPAGVLSQKAKPEDVSVNEWVVGYMIRRWRESGLTDGECALRVRGFRPSVCNRLDRNTGGILICALSLQGSRVMTGLLRDRSLHKYYRMIVKGQVSERGSAGGFLYKDKKTNRVTLYSARGKAPEDVKEIRTDYVPVRYNEKRGLTLVEAELVTGKTHQLRAHMAFIGHPIIGDDKYGDRTLNRRLGVHGQLLFCCRIKMPQDTGMLTGLSGKVISARVPDYFDKVMDGT